MASEFIRKTLENELRARKTKNPSYSLRSFAQDIGMTAPTLSRVISGNRNLPLAQAELVARKIGLCPNEQAQFIEEAKTQKLSLREVIDHDSEEYFEADEVRHQEFVENWEYPAILNLFNTVSFNQNNKWIAKRLDIPLWRCEEVIDQLVKMNFLEQNNECLRRKETKITTSHGVRSESLRRYHRNYLERVKEPIDSVRQEHRSYSSTIFSVSLANIPKLKNIIFDFQKKVAEVAQDLPGDEVYELGCQLTPLTEINTLSRRKK